MHPKMSTWLEMQRVKEKKAKNEKVWSFAKWYIETFDEHDAHIKNTLSKDEHSQVHEFNLSFEVAMSNRKAMAQLKKTPDFMDNTLSLGKVFCLYNSRSFLFQDTSFLFQDNYVRSC